MGLVIYAFYLQSVVKRSEKRNVFKNVKPLCDSLKLMDRSENANKCIVQNCEGTV